MDTWTGRLSEYLDDTLAGSERAALDAHLAGCAACRATLDELRRVVARARGLEDRPPAADLWPGIAERIGVSAEVVSLAARRRALDTDPNSVYLHQHLAETLRRKSQFLRRATTLVSART